MKSRVVFRRVRNISAAALLGLVVSAAARAQTAWPLGGADMFNTHASLSPDADAGTATQITPRSASKLKLKWSLVTGGAVVATPTIEPGGLYVPDTSGHIYKVNPATGAVIWSHALIEYTQLWGSQSRSSPAIGPNSIVFGDYWAHDLAHTSNTGALVMAVRKDTGALIWKTVVDKTNQWSEILGSPLIYNGKVYVGTASWEEAHTTNPNYVPTFRGSIVALDLATGKILWQTYMTPPGYTGVAVPGTTPTIWPATHSLIVATGNNYTIPDPAGDCTETKYPDLKAMDACLDTRDLVDSVVALNFDTGVVQWSRQFGGPDTWNFACALADPTVHDANCKYGPGYDYDFASQPQIMQLPNFVGVPDDRGGSSNGAILGAGQKSGVYWALNPANGGLYWSKLIARGGIEWGSALNIADKNAVFVALHNNPHDVNVLAGQNGKTITSNAGAWTSLDIRSGKINWQIPTVGQDLMDKAAGGTAQGAVGFFNRVVFAGSSSGIYVAMDAASGNVLWTYDSGQPVAGGAAFANETVYWGTGYRTVGTGKPTLFAFSVPPP